MKTVYHANAILNKLKTDGAYLGFLVDEPTSATVYNEVTGTGYARTAIPFGTVADGQVENSADISVAGNLFNKTIRYIGVFDAATSGNLLRYYRVSGDEWLVNTTNPLTIGVGNLIIRET